MMASAPSADLFLNVICSPPGRPKTGRLYQGREAAFVRPFLIGDRETVPVTACLADVAGMTRDRLDLVTKPEDEVVDGPRQLCICMSPHVPQQVVARHDAATSHFAGCLGP